ncbi:MAG: universal stress protein, partial [Elusimicrobia bacterium]|nr:universal stress protein [Elusimicrobiota bacterium]
MLRFPPRRILAAVDGSEVSVRAWKAARDVAARFGAVLDAVWFEPPPAQDLSVYDAPLLPDPGWARAAEAALRRRLGPDARLHS